MSYNSPNISKNMLPREKLVKRGVNSLSNTELLSIILRTGTSDKNVKELSAEILENHKIYSLPNRSTDEFKEFKGISTVKASQLKALGELALRMQNEEKKKINSFSDLKMRVQDMKFMETEKFRLFLLSSGNQLLHETDVDGEVNSVSFKSQKIFRLALKNNASAMILAHNHPSDNPDPTEKDIQTTKELVEMGNKIGIEILDHVIVGDKAKSMRKDSVVEF